MKRSGLSTTASAGVLGLPEISSFPTSTHGRRYQGARSTRRAHGRIAAGAAVAALAVLGCSDALAGTVSKDVKLAQGSNKQSVSLAPVSKTTVFRVSVTGPAAANVTVDLRGKDGSVTGPGIFTSTNSHTRLRIYTYRPLDPGKYNVVLAKTKGPAANVKLQVTTSPAEPAKPATVTKTTH